MHKQFKKKISFLWKLGRYIKPEGALLLFLPCAWGLFLSGEFTIVNPHLVTKLKELGLWDDVMINDLKFFEGSLAQISRIPDEVKTLFSTAHPFIPFV